MSKSNPWLVRRTKDENKLRLYCFAYAGGSASVYSNWQDELGSEVEVCAIQLPGRGTRFGEMPIQSMSVLTQEIARAIVADSSKSFAFFGHSLGALVSFEVSRYLRGHYLPQPRHLFVSGCAAPQCREPSRKLHQLPDDELLDELKDYNGTPPEILSDRTLMTLLLPMIRADFGLAEEYIYRAAPKLNLPISVFTGAGDTHVSDQQASGWGRETTGPCQVHVLDGDHFFLHHQRAFILKQIANEVSSVEFA